MTISYTYCDLKCITYVTIDHTYCDFKVIMFVTTDHNNYNHRFYNYDLKVINFVIIGQNYNDLWHNLYVHGYNNCVLRQRLFYMNK